jgi:hypothetical protein
MIKALANVMPRHLLDRRLNPPRALGQQLSDRLNEVGETDASVPIIPLLTARP